MMKRFFAPLAIVVTAALMGHAIAQMTAPAPTSKMTLPEMKVGEKVKGELELTFAKGWHGYPNPPAEDYNIPVSLSSASKEFTLVKVEYPKGTELKDEAGHVSKVYQDTVKFPFTIKAPDKAGEYTFKMKVSYQQCSKDTCLPPGDITVTANVKVK